MSEPIQGLVVLSSTAMPDSQATGLEAPAVVESPPTAAPEVFVEEVRVMYRAG